MSDPLSNHDPIAGLTPAARGEAPLLVSVVIVCYRQAQFLADAIESVLAQTYPAVEIIVVNDGSDDNTDEVAARYGDRIVYLRRDNGGPSAARNSGIARAGGAYLKFLDADDHLHTDQIARQVAGLEGRMDRVSLTTVRKYWDGEPGRIEDHVPSATSLLPDLFRDIAWGGLHGFLFPTRLVRGAGGFDELLYDAEDWEFLTRIGLLEPGFITDKNIGAYYRMRSDSRSTNKMGVAETMARVIIRLHDRLRDGRRADWFQGDLLGFEQRIYYNLLASCSRERELRRDLIASIRELQRTIGIASPQGGRFGFLVSLVGYPVAARARLAYYSKILRIKHA